MRIKSLEIENFKLFTEKFSAINKIADSDIIILNGPNGYGKTSIFDAIEFVLTGEIKRINKYNEDLGVKKNSAYYKKILITDETKKAYIKIELENEENTIEINRIYNPSKSKNGKISKDNNPHKIFEKFKIELSINGEKISEEYIENKLIEYHLSDVNDFYDKCCFLSQDEHLEFLKAANTDKATALEFLFEIPKEQQSEMEEVKNLINKLENNNRVNDLGCIKKLENKLNDEINVEIEKIETSLKKSEIEEGKKIEYKRIFFGEIIYWDKEVVCMTAKQYDEVIEEIKKLKYFSINIESCLNYIYNYPFKEIIEDFNGGEENIVKKNCLEYSYRYYSLLKNESDIDLKYKLQQKYELLTESIKKKELEKINWSFVLENELLDKSAIEKIKEKLEEIKNIEKTQKTISKVITNITSARTSLIKDMNKAMDENIINDNVCPVCGREYENRKNLDENIEKETNVLKSLCDEAASKIGSIIDSLYKEYFTELLVTIEKNLKDIISEKIYQKLQEVKKNRSIINKIKELLERIDIMLPENYETDVAKIENGYKELIKDIKGNLKYIPRDVENLLEEKDFIHEYEKYYKKNEENFKKITSELLDIKEEYIRRTFYNSEVKLLNLKKEEKRSVENRINKLTGILKDLKNYRDAIQRGIDLYKKKIIQDIEPILYVYTAKILQQKFNGKSIFISSDEEMKNIQFINSINDKQDILYTMSSGQLAAVSLSFLLCMNQIYAKQILPVLLIDDPIQTIDDVNMVGLVDILRYEFSDRQIFISTHEQKFEWYLKYKYEKANKKIKPFNMKNLIL